MNKSNDERDRQTESICELERQLLCVVLLSVFFSSQLRLRVNESVVSVSIAVRSIVTALEHLVYKPFYLH